VQGEARLLGRPRTFFLARSVRRATCRGDPAERGMATAIQTYFASGRCWSSSGPAVRSARLTVGPEGRPRRLLPALRMEKSVRQSAIGTQPFDEPLLLRLSTIHASTSPLTAETPPAAWSSLDRYNTRRWTLEGGDVGRWPKPVQAARPPRKGSGR
jgi:hypothetical protein